MSFCTDSCATPVPCPTCGRDLPPRGRSMPMEMSIQACCDDARHSQINTRHLWDTEELGDQK